MTETDGPDRWLAQTMQIMRGRGWSIEGLARVFKLTPGGVELYLKRNDAPGNGTSSTREYVQCPACGGHTSGGDHAGGVTCNGTLKSRQDETAVDCLRRIADEDIGGNAPWLADELHGFADRLAASMRGDSPQSCYFWDIRAGGCHFEVLVPGCSPCAACPGCDAPDVARRYSFTRAGLVNALAHLEVSVPATGPAAGEINAESMADAIIEALKGETT